MLDAVPPVLLRDMLCESALAVMNPQVLRQVCRGWRVAMDRAMALPGFWQTLSRRCFPGATDLPADAQWLHCRGAYGSVPADALNAAWRDQFVRLLRVLQPTSIVAKQYNEVVRAGDPWLVRVYLSEVVVTGNTVELATEWKVATNGAPHFRCVGTDVSSVDEFHEMFHWHANIGGIVPGGEGYGHAIFSVLIVERYVENNAVEVVYMYRMNATAVAAEQSMMIPLPVSWTTAAFASSPVLRRHVRLQIEIAVGETWFQVFPTSLLLRDVRNTAAKKYQLLVDRTRFVSVFRTWPTSTEVRFESRMASPQWNFHLGDFVDPVENNKTILLMRFWG